MVINFKSMKIFEILNPFTFILRILYRTGNLKRVQSGYYYYDYSNIRVTYSYLKILDKLKTKNFCGNWHSIILCNWQILYLIPEKKKKEKIDKLIFP